MVREITPISPRVLRMTLNGNPRLTVISIYSPTEGDSDENAEEFHEDVRMAVNTTPAHNILLVLGDFNAHLSKERSEDPCWYFHENTNRNGRLLRDTLLEANLEATNLRFRKKPGKMWTYISDMHLTKSQIDFILVRRKWRNSVLNTEPYNYFSPLGSDHRLVMSEVRVSLRKSKAKPRRILYDWEAFKKDQELQMRYTVEVRNRFSALCEEDEDYDDECEASIESATRRYGYFTTAVAEAGEALVPKRKRKMREDYSEDPRVCAAREKLRVDMDKYHADPSEERKRCVEERKEELYATYIKAREEVLTEKIRRVESAADKCKSKESWSIINEITGRKRGRSSQIQGTGPEDRMRKWLDHFKTLLGQPPSTAQNTMEIRQLFKEMDMETGSFTCEELKRARGIIKEDKAYGEDGVAPEVMKRCDFDDIILEFCNQALEKGVAPNQWRISNIIPVPKKGDLTDTNNYRGISLTSLVAKTLNRMILNRIQPEIEKKLRDNQNGFRKGRSTTSHILMLRRILEGARAKSLPAVMLFIDFRKAFDSVNRNCLMKILRAYGIPKKIVDLISLLYSNTRAQVITPDGTTEFFEILAGVLQGDTLAPYLFVIVIDYCMRMALEKHQDSGFTVTPARSRRVKAKKISDAEFADDIALVTNTEKEAEELLREVEEVSMSVGLHINESKTKYLVENVMEPQGIVSTDGKPIKLVEDFLYLGAKIRNTEEDVVDRVRKAWAACHSLKSVWQSDLRKGLKIRLFTATVESVLLYGSETWTLTKRLTKMLDGCYTRMLRMALSINQYLMRMRNSELYENLPKVSSKVTQRRLKLSGHAQRHPELTLHSVILWEPLHGKAKRGRPRRTYVDSLRMDTGLKETQDIAGVITDKGRWRELIRGSREYYPT